MRKISLLAIGGLIFFIASKIENGWMRSGLVQTDSSKYERDILPDILAANNNKLNAPPVFFKSGHVKETRLKNYYEKTEDGYCIRLPNLTMVPSPAIVNGTVYLSGGFGSKEFYAFDALTGKSQWAITLDDDGPSSPAVDEGVVIFNTESCTIFGCDLITGKMIWSYWLGDPLMSMPTISGGIVFTSYPAPYPGAMSLLKDTANGHHQFIPTHVLIAIESKTGKIVWQKWIDSDIMSAPVAKDDLLYVTTFSGALYKIEQKTGNILEAKAIRATSAPVFKGNEIIVSRRSDDKMDSITAEEIVIGKKTVYRKKAAYLDQKVQDRSALKGDALKMDIGNGFIMGAPGTSNWQVAYNNIGQSNVSSLQNFNGSRGLYQNGQYYTTMGDEIICTDDDGQIKWKYKLEGNMQIEGGFMGTPPVYANGNIILATYTGEVLIIDEKGGKTIRKYKVNNPVRCQPVIDNGWIYVTTTNGRMFAINTGDKAITGWNMWGANAARTNTLSDK